MKRHTTFSEELAALEVAVALFRLRLVQTLPRWLRPRRWASRARQRLYDANQRLAEARSWRWYA